MIDEQMFMRINIGDIEYTTPISYYESDCIVYDRLTIPVNINKKDFTGKTEIESHYVKRLIANIIENVEQHTIINKPLNTMFENTFVKITPNETQQVTNIDVVMDKFSKQGFIDLLFGMSNLLNVFDDVSDFNLNVSFTPINSL